MYIYMKQGIPGSANQRMKTDTCVLQVRLRKRGFLAPVCICTGSKFRMEPTMNLAKISGLQEKLLDPI